MANIIETAISCGNFTNLVRAIQQAGLVNMFAGPGQFTLFAPSDEAFSKLPPGMFENFLRNRDQLRSLLSYHVAQGRHLSQEIKGSVDLKTLIGETLLIRRMDDKIMIGDAKVIQPDIIADNGVIHAIDNIVMPKLMKQKVA